jgi:hypothetical protein
VTGQLDGEVAHRPGPARDQDRLSGDGAVAEHGPVSGECGDAEACAEVEADGFGQGDGLAFGQAHPLGGGAVGPAEAGEVHPYALAEARRIDAFPDRVDLAGPVLVGIT